MERNEEFKNIMFILFFIVVISFFSIGTKKLVESAVNKDRLVVKEVAKNDTTKTDVVVEQDSKVEVVEEEIVTEEVVEENAKQREQKLVVRDNVTAVVEIARVNIRAEVVEGTDAKTLKVYAGKFDHSVNPGQIGNFSVAAHNNIDTELFRNLYKVQIGDIVRVVTKDGEYKYKVTQKFKVLPTQFEVTDNGDKAEITLITCTQGTKRRLVVKGELIK